MIKSISGNPLKGECLLIVEGFKEEALDLSEADLLVEIDFLVAAGAKKIKLSKKWLKNMVGIRVNYMLVIMSKSVSKNDFL